MQAACGTTFPVMTSIELSATPQRSLSQSSVVSATSCSKTQEWAYGNTWFRKSWYKHGFTWLFWQVCLQEDPNNPDNDISKHISSRTWEREILCEKIQLIYPRLQPFLMHIAYSQRVASLWSQKPGQGTSWARALKPIWWIYATEMAFAQCFWEQY